MSGLFTKANGLIARSLMAAVMFGFMGVVGVVNAQTEEHAALSLVKGTTKTIQQKIKDQDEAINKDIEVLYDLVNTIVLPNFDFRKMSGWVMGKNWRKANAAQKKNFTNQFSRLLVRTYSKALHDNTDQKIEFLPIRGKAKKDEVIIRTEIPQKAGFPIPINYKMHLKNNQWKVYDVVIDSISLVANYRTSFNQEIRKSGIDGLIKKLTDRNNKPFVDKTAKK
jgi:phospholipid transport system substrate-binding protein